MKFNPKFEEGKLIGFTMMPENDADFWFLKQSLVVKEHCEEQECKLKILKLKK